VTILKFPRPFSAPPAAYTTAPAVSPADRPLRYRDVETKTNYSERQIRRKVRNGTFPAPVKLGGTRELGWPSSVIDAWLDAKEGA
jgi:predicted DNA-binding transcriptional regulator AlpA